tara:strand:+ start:4104 stop:4436 length:333 start_codon:yes stop_codon:yes gene_type:complete
MAPLTREEKVAAFKVVTRSLTHWYGDEIIAGVTDERLEELLKNALGIFGGSGGPCRLSICHQGCGLKIWAGHTTVNHVREKPIFQGKATIRMAREVYGIADPTNSQLELF